MDANGFIERRVAMAQTQTEIATALGVTARSVRRWERAEAKIPHSVDLALRYLAGEVRPDPEAPAHE